MPSEKQLKYWDSLKGKPPHNKGKKKTQEQIDRAKEAIKNSPNRHKMGFQKGHPNYNKDGKGLIKKGEHRNPRGEFKKGGIAPMKGRKRPDWTGEKNNKWKGGITPERVKIRTSVEMQLWRNSVFARDNWTDQKTGIRGGKLVAHHILNFSSYPELRFAIDNGITLSEKSHKEFHKKYGKINNTKAQLVEFLGREIW